MKGLLTIILTIAFWGCHGGMAYQLEVLDFAKWSVQAKEDPRIVPARAVGLLRHPKTLTSAAGLFVSPHFFLTSASAVGQVGCEGSQIQVRLMAEKPERKWPGGQVAKCSAIAAVDNDRNWALLEVEERVEHFLPLHFDRTAAETFVLMGYVGQGYFALSEKCQIISTELEGNCQTAYCSAGVKSSEVAKNSQWVADCFAEDTMNGAVALAFEGSHYRLLGLYLGRLEKGAISKQGKTELIGGGWRRPAVFASLLDFNSHTAPDFFEKIQQDLVAAEKRAQKQSPSPSEDPNEGRGVP